jgi:hypothetical protein
VGAGAIVIVAVPVKADDRVVGPHDQHLAA